MIEVLVAMTVLALFAAILLRGVVGVRADAAWFEDRAQLMEVARTVLDNALADRHLRPGTYRGERDGRRWTLTASALDLHDQLPRPQGADGGRTPPSNPTADAQPIWTPQRLLVTLQAAGRPVTIETIRLATAP